MRAAAPPGAIEHILVINLENESESVTFGGCPATGATGNANYLNCVLLPQGELIGRFPLNAVAVAGPGDSLTFATVAQEKGEGNAIYCRCPGPGR